MLLTFLFQVVVFFEASRFLFMIYKGTVILSTSLSKYLGSFVECVASSTFFEF